ncbi:MAG: phosphoribosylformylglycinamidine synthase subunit PurQ [Candidatus Bathyarchaeota archaeon]|nr:phosphoribosylformylglycinamidine synthase subunit PurQ [Candidatus Bathyarchaeota archaeon]
MKINEVRVCIIRVGGTNCDAETRRAFKDLGVKTSIHHLNELSSKRNLLDYHILVFPGGFSYGDYIRAGAILAKTILSRIGGEIRSFVDEGRPILGICNGFQILVEAGLLPGLNGISDYPEAALATNIPIGYRCMWVYLKHEGKSNCASTWLIPEKRILRMPVAHAEGRFLLSDEKVLDRLLDNGQVILRYCNERGEYAEGRFPENPNGSLYDIAGICNPDGTVFGLMPHPERAYYGWQLPDWTRMGRPPKYGDGKLIFESVVKYVAKKF